MPDITIRVTQDLKHRLEAARVAVEPVCQRALVEALLREEARQGREQSAAGTAATADLTGERDESVLEAEGYAAGMVWAKTASSFDLLALFEGDGNEQDRVQVSREHGSLYRALELAGVRLDSETNRVLTSDDPWGRGFLRACWARRDVEQPLG